MRCAPIGLFDHANIDKLIKDSIEISQITHYDPRCTYSNVVLNYLIAQNLRSDNKYPPKDYLNNLNYAIDSLVSDHSEKLKALLLNVRRKIKDFIDGKKSFEEAADEYYNKGGYVLDSLAIVLLSFYCTKSYKEGLIECVNFGSDNDTTGAIYGGLAGSFYGFNGLPEEWVSRLKNLKFLNEKYEEFYTIIRKKNTKNSIQS